MIIFPAIDLKDGVCVRLKKGVMENATVFNTDPAAQARTFAAQGFQWLHCVDLNGAFAGASANSANASGKTTLIKSILGMVIPDEGTILFHGKPTVNTFDYKRQIGYMPQIGHYPDNMKIGQLFKMIMDIRQQDALDTDLLKAYQLEGMYQKTMRTLSGGTLQKVSAALAFMFDPDVLILDEPSAGLDPLAAETLKEKILHEKSKGKLIVITSHILSEADEISDHIMYLFEGNIKFYKTLKELKDETGEHKLNRALTKILS